MNNNKDGYELNHPPLVDHKSAFQNGLLDALRNRTPLWGVLIAAEERILNDKYCEGYAAGCNLTLTKPSPD